MKILVIDDAADFRLYVSVLLQRWGYEAEEAADGFEGLARIQENDIRLVICDWMMPEMSGPELCRAIRANDLGHYVYIILLTGRSESADLVAGLNAGADDFVTKPFEAQVLRARLRVAERILALEQRLAEQTPICANPATGLPRPMIRSRLTWLPPPASSASFCPPAIMPPFPFALSGSFSPPPRSRAIASISSSCLATGSASIILTSPAMVSRRPCSR